MSAEPTVPVPFPSHYGSPGCPACGYACGCCCNCECQTAECPTPDTDGDCDCDGCHGGHEPWDCHRWVVRYDWARAKSKRLEAGA